VKGRKPKPTSLKLLEGNRGKRAAVRSEPKPESKGVHGDLSPCAFD